MDKLTIRTRKMNKRLGITNTFDVTRKSGIEAFAPTWDMVMGFKKGVITWEEYEKQYHELMLVSVKEHKEVWVRMLKALNRDGEICFLCYCHDPNICHRRLLAQYMAKLAKKHLKKEVILDIQ